MLQFTCTGPFRRSCAHFEGILPKKNILHRYCVLVVQSDMTHQCRNVKSCLKLEIWQLNLDMLPCNPEIGVHYSHLVLWGRFWLPLYLMVIGTCCLSPSRNIIIFLLYAKFDSLVLWIMLVTCWSASFSGNLRHMYVLVLFMADVVDFWCFMI